MVEAAKEYRIEEADTGYDCEGADVWRSMIDAELGVEPSAVER